MTADISIIIVTYNSAELIGGCLESFFADPFIDRCEVIVVDNSSSDGGSTQRAVAEFPRARFIQTGRNGGFGAGNNAGIALASAPLVLIANPDTRIADGGLAGLVTFMRDHSSAGLVGPRLLNEDKTPQHSIRRYPRAGREIAEGLLLHRLIPPFNDRISHVVESPVDYAISAPVDWVSGAVMLARTHALRSIGGFDEGFFLYSEEIDLAVRLAQRGWQVWYTPSVSFFHIGGENDENVLLGVETQRSKLRYYLKHEGRGRMLLVAAASVLRLSVRAIVWLVPAALNREPSWRKRLRTSVRVLARYPALVARLVFARIPTTISGGLSQ